MEHDCLIRLEGLCLDASIGIDPHELAARSDDIRHTEDYDQVVDRLEALLASRHFHLLEHLSQAMLDTLADSFPVKRAEVTVAKPLAVLKARRVSVTRKAGWRREAVKAVPLAL